MVEERVHKVLSRMGFGSRREIERLIEQHKIIINGKTAEPGDRVRQGDQVSIGSRRVTIRQDETRPRVLMYHKPAGEVCTRKDEQGRPTVFAKLPPVRDGRWINVGRLDINTSGLLLLTNHGELANRLMHPSHAVEREYAVRVNGTVTDDMIEQLKTGVELDDGPGRFDDIVDSGGRGSNSWFHVVLREGRKREVRRLWEAVGVRVSRLIRVRYGDIILPRRLRQGHAQELDAEQVKLLAGSVGLNMEMAEGGRSTGSARKKTGRSKGPPRKKAPRSKGRKQRR